VRGTGIACGAIAPGSLAKRPALLEASTVFALCAADAAALRALGVAATPIETLLRERRAELPPPAGAARIACDGTAEERALVEALGHEPADAGPDPLPSRFAISPAERAAAEARLERAERLGVGALLVRDPFALARWALVARQGSWRASRVAPAMPHQIAALALRGAAPGFRALRAGSRFGEGHPESVA
jgi:hypothetical protein